MRKRLSDYGIKIGRFNRGKRNLITDVPGIRVGNHTFISDEGGIFRTGVTVVFPHEGNVYEERVFAGAFVLNGYGKSTGLVQIDELGTLETPIFITSTLNVGKVWDAAVEYMLSINKGLRSVNPVVMECNDIRVNEAEKRPLGKEHVLSAIKDASEDFKLGNVGAGTGMVTFGFKGGLGSSSRVVNDYVVGALVVSNFGKKGDLIGSYDERKDNPGSIIVVIGTNAPLIPYQLKRLSRRGAIGITRTGGRATHGSGDIVLSFSTAHKIKRKGKINMDYIPDDSETFQNLLDASIDVVEEAIYDALLTAEDIMGRDGKVWKGVDPTLLINIVRSRHLDC